MLQRTVEPIIDVPMPQVLQQGATEAEALQFQVRAISNEIQEKYSGKEDILTKTTEVKMQLDELFKRIAALRKQKSGILGQVWDQKLMAEYIQKEVGKIKGFRSVSA